MRFSRHSRLLKPEQFRSVFKQPIRSSDEYFRIMARTNGLTQHRLGMAVSRKVSNKAVDRNRIKRVVREHFRCKMLGQSPVPGLDFVVLPTTLAASQGNKALDESLSEHWKKLTRKAEKLNQGIQKDQLRIQR